MLVYRVELKASAVIFKSRITNRSIFDTLKDASCKNLLDVKIEGIARMGPYCGSNHLPANACRWLRQHGLDPMISIYYDEIRHPNPHKDITLCKNISKRRDITHAISSFLYGFESLESLSRWFDVYIRDELHRGGYVVMVYEAEEIYTGECQLIFNPATAKPVDIIHLDEFKLIYTK